MVVRVYDCITEPCCREVVLLILPIKHPEACALNKAELGSPGGALGIGSDFRDQGGVVPTLVATIAIVIYKCPAQILLSPRLSQQSCSNKALS